MNVKKSNRVTFYMILLTKFTSGMFSSELVVMCMICLVKVCRSTSAQIAHVINARPES